MSPAAANRSRWRFTFRLSTLFVVMTIAALVCNWPQFYRQWQVGQIKRYVNKDLRSLPKEEQIEFRSRVGKLWPESVSNATMNPEYWHFWRFTTDRGPRLVLFQRDILVPLTSDSECYLALFDDSGNLVRQVRLTPTWRSSMPCASRQ